MASIVAGTPGIDTQATTTARSTDQSSLGGEMVDASTRSQHSTPPDANGAATTSSAAFCIARLGDSSRAKTSAPKKPLSQASFNATACLMRDIKARGDIMTEGATGRDVASGPLPLAPAGRDFPTYPDEQHCVPFIKVRGPW